MYEVLLPIRGTTRVSHMFVAFCGPAKAMPKKRATRRTVKGGGGRKRGTCLSAHSANGVWEELLVEYTVFSTMAEEKLVCRVLLRHYWKKGLNAAAAAAKEICAVEGEGTVHN